MDIKLYIGIDIGGTAIKCGVVNEYGEIVDQKEFMVDKKATLLATVIRSVKDFKSHCELKNYPIDGIGVSATGQIDGEHGIVIGTGGNIKDWDQVNLRQVIGSIFNLPIIVENDVNCAALGEHWIGSGRSYKHLFVYTIGTGIGGALILNNQLYTGALGVAGEFGHMSIKSDGLSCTCGRKGCFEQYGSTTALLREANKVLPMPVSTGRELFDIYQKHLYSEQIDPILNDFIDYQCEAIINILHLLNPEAVLIGGGISQQEELLIVPIRESVKRRAMKNFSKEIVIKSTQLGNQAGMIGAVKNIMNYLSENGRNGMK